MAQQKVLQQAVLRRLREITKERKRLEREVEALDGEYAAMQLLAERYGVADQAPPARAIAAKLPKPTEAVIALLTKEPGLMTRDVVERLENAIATDSNKPRRLIRSTVEVLRRRGKLAKGEGGALTVVPSQLMRVG